LSVPEPGFHWPAGALRGNDNESVAALKRCFGELGYEECANGNLETGYKKVALYAIRQDDWTHAAVQDASGAWSSKLGDGFDIRHKTPHCVAGPLYGTVMCYLKRAFAASPTDPPARTA